ncbi:MAG: helix-turn-helix domain-containing protein [Ignavibacteria bacterium]|nr:helix-turn-helix domain-containing protein [Ignavibacteria bacterium]
MTTQNINKKPTIKAWEMSKDKILYRGIWHYSISKEFVFNSNLSRDARFLHIVLKSFTNDKKKEAFPAREYLCATLICSDKSLTKYLKELENSKLVIKTRERSEGGKYEHNVYEIVDYIPKPPNVKFTNGKNSDLTNGTCTIKVDVPTSIIQYLSNNISKAQLLISDFNPDIEDEITKLAKLINKFNRLLGEEKLHQVLFYLLRKVVSKEKTFVSIGSLGEYLGGCVKNTNQSQIIELELV